MRKIRLLFFLLPLFSGIKAQDTNIFSEKNTADFARFLYNSNQYRYAAEEYERLTYTFPHNNDYQMGLLRSYRMANDYASGITAYQGIVIKGITPIPEVKNEYIKLNLLQGNTQNLTGMIGEFDTDSRVHYNLDLTLRLITDIKYAGIEGIDINMVDKGLLNLYNDALSFKYKSPFLAGTFSALIPGTGKIYSGRWKDGLVSLLFIAATSFQAYRGFERKGVKSAYGWIMGGISFGFYIGNVYGSAKAARLYNQHQNSHYVEKVTDYYIDNL